jgi:hypothetical protein
VRIAGDVAKARSKRKGHKVKVLPALTQAMGSIQVIKLPKIG